MDETPTNYNPRIVPKKRNPWDLVLKIYDNIPTVLMIVFEVLYPFSFIYFQQKNEIHVFFAMIWIAASCFILFKIIFGIRNYIIKKSKEFTEVK